MDAKEIAEYGAKLALNPETQEREIQVRDLDKAVYDELKPYITAELPWPVIEQSSDEMAPADEPPADQPPASEPEPEVKVSTPAQPPREVVVAKSTIERARARAEKYKGQIAELDSVIATPLPDRFLDEDAYFAARDARDEALNKKATLAFEYSSARDVEDVEMAESVVHQSEFSRTVESIGDAYEQLKLPRDFDTMRAEYDATMIRAMKELGTEDVQAAFDKLQADPEFAKKVGALPEGYETLFIYIHADEARKKHGGTLKGHVLELAHDQGIFKKMRESDRDAARRAIADKNDKALHARATEAKPASITAGSGEPPAGPIIIRDKESARKWLQESNAIRADKTKRLSDAEKAENSRKDRLAREFLLDSGTQRPLTMPA